MPTAGSYVQEPAALLAGYLPLEDAAPLAGPFAANSDRVTWATVTVSAGIGHGSGVIISPRGWILTNNHVVGGAELVRIRLQDGTALVGRVERRHPARDAALVKVDAWGLPFLPVRPHPLVVGEDVHAIGTPLKVYLHTTVTRGIVSAFRVEYSTGLPLIQADVDINSGNSGGPLVDGAGNLVGLSVAGYAVALGGSIGLNLFIPIGDALERLGIRMASATASP
ncbi:MAG TPA: trypsin-like peptidase domain-containing protein, partial [Arenibaculum sp.]|nr:trypsin-like peptidase domain-containing protein [Arenibaculum sp.]